MLVAIDPRVNFILCMEMEMTSLLQRVPELLGIHRLVSGQAFVGVFRVKLEMMTSVVLNPQLDGQLKLVSLTIYLFMEITQAIIGDRQGLLV